MGPQVIQAHEGEDGMRDAENFWEKRVREAEEKAKKRAEEYAKEQEQYLKVRLIKGRLWFCDNSAYCLP